MAALGSRGLRRDRPTTSRGGAINQNKSLGVRSALLVKAVPVNRDNEKDSSPRFLSSNKEIDQSVVLPLWSSTEAIRSLDLTNGSSRFEAQDKYVRRTQLRCEITSRYGDATCPLRLGLTLRVLLAAVCGGNDNWGRPTSRSGVRLPSRRPLSANWLVPASMLSLAAAAAAAAAISVYTMQICITEGSVYSIVTSTAQQCTTLRSLTLTPRAPLLLSLSLPHSDYY